MKIKKYQPDQEGYMHPRNIIRPLSFGLHEGKPSFWAVIDELGKTGINAKLVVKRDDDSIGSELLPNYRQTLLNDKTGEIWHIFEEPNKIITGSMQPNPKGLK